MLRSRGFQPPPIASRQTRTRSAASRRGHGVEDRRYDEGHPRGRSVYCCGDGRGDDRGEPPADSRGHHRGIMLVTADARGEFRGQSPNVADKPSAVIRGHTPSSAAEMVRGEPQSRNDIEVITRHRASSVVSDSKKCFSFASLPAEQKTNQYLVSKRTTDFDRIQYSLPPPPLQSYRVYIRC